MAKLVRVSDLTPHPKLGGTDLLPSLSDDEYHALVASVRESGIMQPLVVAWPEKVILDGHHRWRAAQDLGIEEVPIVTEEFASEERRLALGVELNVARRHLSSEQKREAAAALLRENPARSDRSIAASVGVSPTTVGSVRFELEEAGEVSKMDTRVGQDGVKQPARRPAPTGSKRGETPVIPIRRDGSIDKLAALRQAREADAAPAPALDIKSEIRDVKREVANSPWGRLSGYLTAISTREPPKLTKDEIREAVTGDTDGGWYVTARIIRDFLNVVLAEVDSAKEATSAASR